jgi:aspartyl/asparaginyl-tRNA synthetase
MKSSEDQQYSNSYSIIFRSIEICSGSQREHDYDILIERMKTRKINSLPLQNYVSSFCHGTRPHGGACFELEKIVSLYLDFDNTKLESQLSIKFSMAFTSSSVISSTKLFITIA